MGNKSTVKIIFPLAIVVIVSMFMMIFDGAFTDDWDYDSYLPDLKIVDVENLGENEDGDIELKVYIENCSDITCECFPYIEAVTDENVYLEWISSEQCSEGEIETEIRDIPGGETSWAIYIIYADDYEGYIEGHECVFTIAEYETNLYEEFKVKF